jgi:PhnB protein
MVAEKEDPAMNSQPTGAPEGYPPLSPYIAVRDGAAAIAFYEKVLDARARMRMERPDGRVGHAELELPGGAVLMLADEMPGMGFGAPAGGGSAGVLLHLYVADVDATFSKALAAGAKELRPVSNQFYGDRAGSFEDPFGHRWHVATNVEQPSEEEIRARMAKMGQPC